MSSDDYIRSCATLPWKRKLKSPPLGRHVIRQLKKEKKWNPKRRKFDMYPENENIDLCTKRATLTASPSVTSVECYSGDEIILQCSGFVIESSNKYSIILTTAKVVKCSTSGSFEKDDIKIMVHMSDGRSFKAKLKACDYYFGIAALRIRPNIRLPVASLARVNDSITVDKSHLHIIEEKLQSTSFDLIPGNLVIALGRFPIKPYSIMAAPGLFSIDRCNCDCKELFTASCRITSSGIGGPIISHYGEVIGIGLYDDVSTPFLPINIASLWWEQYKELRQTRRPCLGMGVTNLYAAPLDTLEIITRKFPMVMEGVIVEEVVRGSSAESAGVQRDDVIIQFCGKTIKSFLELYESAWNKLGETVDLIVVRASNDVPLQLTMRLDYVNSE